MKLDDLKARLLRELDRAIERIMSVEIEAMQGDNLAVTLCSAFDRDDDSEPDDNGWSQSAIDAYEDIKNEIAGLFVPVRVAATAITDLEALVGELGEALRGAENGLAVLHQYRGLIISCLGGDRDAVRSAEEAFNKAFGQKNTARATLAKLEKARG